VFKRIFFPQRSRTLKTASVQSDSIVVLRVIYDSQEGIFIRMLDKKEVIAALEIMGYNRDLAVC
jgi:hypothetical protein